MHRKRLLSDYSKWLKKREEEKGGISKERRKWRWDHHVYLSWQRFHTSSLNQRSIEQTGIDIPANVGRVFFSFEIICLLQYMLKIERPKTCGFFVKSIFFSSFFFSEIILINQIGIFFSWRMLLFIIEILHSLMLYLTLFCLDSLVFQFLYRGNIITQIETKGKQR